MGLLNPRQIITDTVGLTHRYAVLSVNLVQGKGVVGTYSANGGPAKFSLMILVCSLPSIISRCLAAPIRGCDAAYTASLRTSSDNHVAHVVGLSAKRQVGGVYAGSRIARMPNHHALCYRPNEKNMRHLRAMPCPLVLNKFQGRVAAAIKRFLPNPAAAIRNFVVGMKSFYEAVTPHNYTPVGGFSTHDTGKGGDCGG